MSFLAADEVPVTITYSSDNETVATINRVGRIKAVGEGTAKIIAVITQQDGTSEQFTITVTVKKASIEIVQYSANMYVGEKAEVAVKLYGLKESDLAWKTTKTNRVMVSSNKGKATVTVYAKTTGTDYIVVTAGEVAAKVKVTVSKNEK